MLRSINFSSLNQKKRIAVIGTVGVPSQYGGFETLVDNLIHFHDTTKLESKITVYCSQKAYSKPRLLKYKTAFLRYIPLHANGAHSVFYDIISMFLAIINGDNRVLLLGVSGAVGLPFLRLFPWIKIVTNIDGLEWKRAKWNRLTRIFLRWSERIAVQFSHEIIGDNEAIASYVKEVYGKEVNVIAYGGDHALQHPPMQSESINVPERYALSLCRIEPENNVHVILDAWPEIEMHLVFVGNWENSEYGRLLKRKYINNKNISLIDPIYEPSALRALRDKAIAYVHGHSAGGTNPSLVEMMHFGVPIFAWDCDFNRFTTDESAQYFSCSDDLVAVIADYISRGDKGVGQKMEDIARKKYNWSTIAMSYFRLLENPCATK